MLCIPICYVDVDTSKGGTIELDKSAGNNYPLRGGKLSDFEGGIRAVTVVTGGALPLARRHQVEDGMMHIAGTRFVVCTFSTFLID